MQTVPDKQRHRKRLTSAIWVLLLGAILATAVLTQRSLARLADSRVAIAHSLLINKALNSIMSQMFDAETGQRGFLLSGRAPYLQPYYTALAQVRLSRVALGNALSQDSSAIAPLDVLDKAIAAKLQDLDHAVSLKSEGRSDEAVLLILTDSGNQTMNAVRAAVRSLESDQVRQANQLQVEFEKEIGNYYLALGVSILVNVLLLAGLLLRPSGKDVGSITISIGLSHFPGHGTSVEALLLAADKALYEAKNSGRNKVVVAT